MSKRQYVESSGNVFADLNLPKADDLLVKAELVSKIISETDRRRLMQSVARNRSAENLRAARRERSGFSIIRLMRFLLLLGRDIEIVVKERASTRATDRIRVA